MNNFNWCKYWNLANSYSGSEDDAELRDGISRFYYSAFCTSRNFLIDNKLFLNSTSKNIMLSNSSKVHGETRNIFENHRNLNYNSNGYKISSNLDYLRFYRNMADYDNEIPYDLKTIYNFCKIKSEKVFGLLDEYPY